MEPVNILNGEGGSLPNYSVSKCSEYSESTPMARDIDLISVFKVIFDKKYWKLN